jgi:hypothetical protein
MKFPKDTPPAETQAVSVFRRTRTVVRAVAAAAGTYPAVVVERAIEAYLAVHPELAAVAAAALAAGAEPTAENPGSPTDRGA